MLHASCHTLTLPLRHFAENDDAPIDADVSDDADRFIMRLRHAHV